MGYNSSAATITLTAKLTPFGRSALVANNSFITKFSLGDSDANYFATFPLTTGQVPTESGNIGTNATISNSTADNANIKSFLLFNNTGTLKKLVESGSTVISTEAIANGQTTVSGTNIIHKVINRNNGSTDSLVNLYYSFGLPLNSTQDTTFTGKTTVNGGFSDTSLSGIAQSKIVALAINNDSYGETLDGKEIQIVLPTFAGTYTIYSTFQNKGNSLKTEDANIRDTSTLTSTIDNNIAFLFSDNILRPNSDPTLSWGTGFGKVKPFSLNQKELWNLKSNTNLSKSADTIVGIAYLDKGIIVLTHPTVVADYGNTPFVGPTVNTTITFNSVSTSVSQNITCIAGRGEFGTSTNRTFSSVDTPRISEIGLFDDGNNLIALAKTDRHILKTVNEFKVFGIKITL